MTRPKTWRARAIDAADAQESVDAVYIEHVFTATPDDIPPQSNARSLSNASTLCSARSDGIAALFIHVPGVPPSCISTFVLERAGSPPITYAFPFSVTIVVAAAPGEGSDAMFVHAPFTFAADRSHDISVAEPMRRR